MALVETLAARLRDAYQGDLCSPLRTEIDPADIDTAYAIQAHNNDHWVAGGRRIVGRKIGLTSAAVQAQLGVDQPDFGVLFADMEVAEQEAIPAGRLQQPKIEAEVAFVLGRAIAAPDATLADVVAAVEFALPAFEIVGSRIAGWDIGIVDTIADNASSGLFVLGGSPRRLDSLDLHGAKMTIERAGATVSTGRADACLGNPLNALRWLARALAARGAPLAAGDIVLSGALGPMVAVQPGDQFRATIEGLGQVSAVFA